MFTDASQKVCHVKLSIIVAASENNVIGRQGDLPWRLSADLRRFKRLTMGHALIMGRKTYDSIGRPLPGRVSIVLTQRSEVGGQRSEDVLVAGALQEATELVATTEMNQDEAFVTGGGEIYRLALPQADRIYLTRVHTQIEGDATFPEVNWSEWQQIKSDRHAADEKNQFDCTFEVWQRTL